MLVVVAGCTFEPRTESPDAQTDAQSFECSARFAATLPNSTSRYYIESTRKLAWHAAEMDCEQDRGAHLFTPQNDAEVTAMRALMNDTRLWVGLLQLPNQLSPSVGWFLVTGTPAILSWENEKPDDGGSENNGENAAVLHDDGLDDEDHRSTRPFICECDGSSVDASILSQLAP